MYSRNSFSDIMKTKDNKELVFVHTPKCAGSYIASILSHLNIKNNSHTQAVPSDKYIYFTVIRKPVERFESLLNYRLSMKKPRKDWPKHLLYAHYDKNIKLDEIVSKMSDEDIEGFSPYKTLKYWTKNVDIIITLDNLPQLLKYFGYTYDINSFAPVNVSKKIRGNIERTNKDRIKKLFNDDIKIYNMVKKSTIDH